MKLTDFALRNRTFTVFATVLLVLAGLQGYLKLGRLEDPEYTIKTAVITTLYPGATPEQVEQQVTDKIEKACYKMGELKWTRSISSAGMSLVYVDIKDKYRSKDLPAIWKKLRNKIDDMKPELPPGVQGPYVADDFGDVYGVLLAVTGEGFTYAEIKEYCDMLQKQLALVPNVSKVELWGVQQECIYVEIANSRLVEMGIEPSVIYDALNAQNLVTDAGGVDVQRARLNVFPTGEFTDPRDIEGLVIRGYPSDQLIRLGDVAKVERGYVSPPRTRMRVDGKPCLGLAISTVPGGNVIEMGDDVNRRIDELMERIPVGVELTVISEQGETVRASVQDFVVNLVEAVVIVVITLLVFMGFRCGLIIAGGLLITIMMTFAVMHAFHIDLHRISLGALIIALGMLVDNAIVVTELCLVSIQQGMDRVEAARQSTAKTGIPLLGATVIAATAFFAIYMSNDGTGEYCRDLFFVVSISLLLSWFVAVMVIPIICIYFLKTPKSVQTDPYAGRFYQGYKRFLETALRYRYVTLAIMGGLLLLGVFGFGFVKRAFFPPSERTEFMIDYWLPQGARIETVAEDVAKLEQWLLAQEDVDKVTSFIGSGPPRFYLPLDPELPNQSYACLVVSVTDFNAVGRMMEVAAKEIEAEFPQAEPCVRRFPLGPANKYKVEARFNGPDREELRRLSDQAKAIMAEHGGQGVRDDWRNLTKRLVPEFYEARANQSMVSRRDMCMTLKMSHDGMPIGQYRERDKLIPVIVRPPVADRVALDNLDALPIWGAVSMKSVPLIQLVHDVPVKWDDGLIHRRERKRTITAQCNPPEGVESSELMDIVMPEIEAIELPPGYELEWGGDYESSKDAQAGVSSGIPIAAVIMLIIIVALFNALRQPIIILLTVPLAIVGIAAGLLLCHQPFGFMALLGAMSLSGMIIKNSVVLIDTIDKSILEGAPRYTAVVDSGVSRMRPILMAALTTVLGMLPLAFGGLFYRPMAVTIMFGLTFATVLTLIVCPVFYVVFFSIKKDKDSGAASDADARQVNGGSS